MEKNLEKFASAFCASFEAQIRMFPGMVNPKEDKLATDESNGFLGSVQEYIDVYSAMSGVLAWKLAGAGGGGYLILVCSDRQSFPVESISITIRRS